MVAGRTEWQGCWGMGMRFDINAQILFSKRSLQGVGYEHQYLTLGYLRGYNYNLTHVCRILSQQLFYWDEFEEYKSRVSSSIFQSMDWSTQCQKQLCYGN